VLQPPPAPTGGAWQPANPSDGLLRGKWWEIYQDPQLNQLEDRIAANNQTLRQALETYLAARDQITVARAAFYPTLSAGPSASARENFRKRPLLTRPANPPPTTTFAHRPGQLGAGFLGPHSPHRRGRPLQRPGQRRRQANIDLSLHAEMAADYFQLRGLDAQIKLLDDRLPTWNASST
jgi:outer membrane protein TolC